MTYRIVEARNERDLEKRINEAAHEGWEPINAYSVSGSNVNAGHHYALLRRSAG